MSETSGIGVTAPASTQLATAFGPVTLQLHRDVESLETVWKDLQAHCLATAGQTYSSARAWSRHALAPHGERPIIVLGLDKSERPLFLLAFERRKQFGLTALVWLGQEHANYNMGLFRPEIAEVLTRADMSAIMRFAAEGAGASCALLRSQPYEWDGVPNPVAKLPHQPHPSMGYSVTLGDFQELFHGRFKKESRRGFSRREKKLAEYGPLTFGWAESREEKEELIETFFAQKDVQLGKMGVASPFTPEARGFLRELVFLEDDDPARLRMGFIRIGDSVAATFNGAIYRNRLLVMLSSLAQGDSQRYSPGLVLLRHEIEEACNLGLSAYDIGVGAAQHKERWCDVVRPLFDCFLWFDWQGATVTMPLGLIARFKRSVKNSEVLWPMVQRFRRRFFGRGPEGEEQD